MPHCIRQRRQKIVYILCAAIGLCFLLGLSSIKTHDQIVFTPEIHEKIVLDRHIPVLASDAPIEIYGNAELSSETGGTFLFEDLVIDATAPGVHGISITNTQTPFTIRNCTITGVEDVSALLFYDVSNCTLEDVRVITNEQIGIELYDVYNFTITQCNVTDNWKGITMTLSSFVEISNSTIDANSHTGIFMSTSSGNNKVFWNTLDSNYINAQDDYPTTINNFTQNFWSDYLGEDVDKNKIGDTPHAILQSNGNSDPKPFMLPPDRPPIYWRSTPTTEIREYGDSIIISLDASVNGGLEGWYQNDTRFSISDTGVITNDDWIHVGNHGFNVTIRNLYDDVLSAEFTLQVVDTTLPTWIQTPTNQVVEIGDPFLYDVNATDLSIPLYYWLESSPYFEVSSATGEIQNNDTLPAYVAHPVHIYVRDAEGLQIDATFTVTPEDTRSPVWDVPLSNQIIEYGFVLSYDIDASDFSGLDTWTLNDTRFQIDSSGIVSNATTLDLGTYVLQVSVNDTIGNVLSSTFTVTVEDTTPPEWVIWPTNQIIERGDSLELQLEVSDNAEVAYWTVSDTENFDITTLGRLFSIGTLDQVAYTLIVTAYDSSGNSVSAGFSITVQDTLNPVWVTTLANYTFELGNLVRIPLDAHDYSGLTGWSVDEVAYFAIDSSGVVSNATVLAVGTYIIHVSVSDVVGHVLLGSFTIEIEDTTAPTWAYVPSNLYITAPNILTYQLSTFDLSGIDEWVVNDTDNFMVSEQGLFQATRALPAGEYVVGIIAYDPHGNYAEVTIVVHAFGHDITILALGAGIWGVALLLAAGVIYLFRPERGFFGDEGGS